MGMQSLNFARTLEHYNKQFTQLKQRKSLALFSRIAGPDRQTGGFFQSFWNGSEFREVQSHALATAAFAKLGKIWKSSISFKAKHKLFRSLVSSILTYGCETWTLLADTERRIQVFENKCLRKLLPISYKDQVTNESVREVVVAYVGPQEPLLATVKRRKLAWFGHVTRHDSLSKTILQGLVEGKRRRGRQKKAWCDNIKEWTGMAMYELVRSASDRDAWRQKTASSALRSSRRPHRSRD
ncbi:endonuclease-reverse transcriptase [Elysia marginata]|uniref:Endonuclease-reverse transcriptase n=1 Tax=Elysia marginata TaxID=1093978 RepID=A0AAV4G587_9GAST|nr:endonuclease-reverse transcriptase [Elysia marginata]